MEVRLETARVQTLTTELTVVVPGLRREEDEERFPLLRRLAPISDALFFALFFFLLIVLHIVLP